MVSFIVRRIAILVPMAFTISALIFFASRLSPIDPILAMIPPDMASDSANLEQLREELGLNDHIVLQYLTWLKNIATGDFGYSLQSGQQISEILALRMPATLELVLSALILSTILALTLGLFAGAKKGGIADKLSREIGRAHV